MFEWLKKDKSETVRGAPSFLMEDGGVLDPKETGIGNLTPDWYRRVRTILKNDQERMKDDHGNLPLEYYTLERRVVGLAMAHQGREFKVFQKLEERIEEFKKSLRPLDPFFAFGFIAVALMSADSIATDFVKRISVPKSVSQLAEELYKGKYKLDVRLIVRDSLPNKDIPIRFPPPENRRIPVSGFEGLGIPSEVVERIVHETLPKGLLANINNISYSDESPSSSGFYGLDKEWKTTAGARKTTKTINIYRQVGGRSIDTFLFDLIHESAHLNDWLANNNLSTEERLELLRRVSLRLNDPNRFKSPYVEDIKNKDGQYEEITESLRLGEYFAEIFAAYLSDDYNRLPEADREIISWLIAKTDPVFERTKALATRKGLLYAATL